MNPPVDLEIRIVAALRRIIRAVDLHSRWLVEAHGLTGPQLAVLQEIGRLGTASSGALARSVHLSHPTVTGILSRLEKRGLVGRTRGREDRRIVVVALTESGRAVLAAMPSLLQERFRGALSGIPEWERLTILATLQRIASMMDPGHLADAPSLVRAGVVPLADPPSSPAGAPVPRGNGVSHE